MTRHSARPSAEDRSLPSKEKQRRLAAILSDKENYMKRLGQGMIGPIQLKLRYQGKGCRCTAVGTTLLNVWASGQEAVKPYGQGVLSTPHQSW